MIKNTDNVYLPLKILNFASFLQYQRFVMPISFLFYLFNGLTFSDFILFQSIFNITCLIAKIPMGFLGDIFSKKYILIFAYFLFLLRVVLWIFFGGFWVVLAGEILYGLFKAFYRGNVDSYIYEYLKRKGINNQIISGYGKLSFYSSFGSAISCILGVLLYKYYGFKILLYIEFITQVFAIILLFFIPNIKSIPNKNTYKIKESIMNIIKNPAINFFAYYSALLTGLTTVFVWNFQPLLKASSAPVILFGLINFINQVFRGLAGKFANVFINKFKQYLFSIEYAAVVISFIFLILSLFIKNYVFVSVSLLLICCAIFLFVIFNIYTISKIHENTQDSNRASTSSANTFFGDFASFFFLIIFKCFYDNFGISKALIIFLILSLVLLFPKISKFNKSF